MTINWAGLLSFIPWDCGVTFYYLWSNIWEESLYLFRGIFQGKPSALIRNGKVDREELKKNRMNLNQLQSLLRQSETFSIREVAL